MPENLDNRNIHIPKLISQYFQINPPTLMSLNESLGWSQTNKMHMSIMIS